MQRTNVEDFLKAISDVQRNVIGSTGILESIGKRLPQETFSFPPYNVEKVSDTEYRVTIAAAGFAPEEISIEVKDKVLTVAGAKTTKPDAVFLHRGIASRDFRRTFNLSDDAEVTGASYENGLVHIDVKRIIPEETKARKIEIKVS